MTQKIFFLFSKNLDIENRTRIEDRVQLMNYAKKQASKMILHYGGYLNWIDHNRDTAQSANSRFSLYARTKEIIDFVSAYRIKVKD